MVDLVQSAWLGTFILSEEDHEECTKKFFVDMIVQNLTQLAAQAVINITSWFAWNFWTVFIDDHCGSKVFHLKTNSTLLNVGDVAVED